MAITDPTAVGFCNEKVRPLANMLAQMYYSGKAIIDEYEARGGTEFIPNDPDEEVMDGAQTDSRPVITGQNVTRIGQIMTEIIDAFEANDEEKLGWIFAVAHRPTMLPPGSEIV
jgi:mevalonate kinase